DGSGCMFSPEFYHQPLVLVGRRQRHGRGRQLLFRGLPEVFHRCEMQLDFAGGGCDFAGAVFSAFQEKADLKKNNEN
ncbi:MAG: hypothetical protein Q4B44_07060, partial [Erysipelotrichaceae bacterium]|nr:hypothetical protein [Erysipelotrichaceae bacterium]